MPDFSYTEGRLRFEFANVDFAEQYDEWSHYRNQSCGICGGSKAVDFLCLQTNICWLIEVKDYRQHQRTKPSLLADELALKVRDTIAGLVSAKMNANDVNEKRVAAASLNCTSIRVAIHLEQPRRATRLRPRVVEPATLKQQLQQRLKAIDAHPVVFDQHSIPYNLSLIVT